MKQQTISSEISFSGVGLHTGADAEMTLCPAPEGYGIRFQRLDIPGQPLMEAVSDHIANTERSTVLLQEQVGISTTEHLLAAFFGMGIDNVLVKLNGPEVPILDGSALPFASAIDKNGIRQQDAIRKYMDLKAPVRFFNPETGTVIEAIPADTFTARVIIDFNSEVLGRQEFTYTSKLDFLKEIASSRTFVFLHEVLFLFKSGLVRGGDLDNALVIAEKALSEEDVDLLRYIFNKPDVSLQKGYLNDAGPRFPDECARHKTMDLLGDLMLVGKRFNARVTAYKPGHAANTAVAQMIRNQIIE